jgi:hypothetical protein
MLPSRSRRIGPPQPPRINHPPPIQSYPGGSPQQTPMGTSSRPPWPPPPSQKPRNHPIRLEPSANAGHGRSNNTLKAIPLLPSDPPHSATSPHSNITPRCFEKRRQRPHHTPCTRHRPLLFLCLPHILHRRIPRQQLTPPSPAHPSLPVYHHPRGMDCPQQTEQRDRNLCPIPTIYPPRTPSPPQ